MEMMSGIPIEYPQNNHDTCLFKSVASALHYLGHKDLGWYFSWVATKYIQKLLNEQLATLCDTAFARDPGIIVTKWMTQGRVDRLDLHMETNENGALIIVPLGADGGIGHAITLVGEYIFDSTQTHALKLDKKSLDWCCGCDHGFKRIFKAVRFA